MDTCRICLKTGELTMIEPEIILIFETCLGLRLRNQAAFLCDGCRAKLLSFNNFREQAWINSKYFITQIKSEIYSYDSADAEEYDQDQEDDFSIAVPIVKVELGSETLQQTFEDFYEETEPMEEDYPSMEEIKYEIQEELNKPVKKKYKRKQKGDGITGEAMRCPNCPEWFETEHQIRRHMKVHEIEAGGLTCHVCGKIYNNPKARNRKLLLMHLQRKHFRDPNERFECDICHATYAHKEAVITHTRFAHSKEPSKFICHKCGKPFGNNWKLENHIRYKHDNVILDYCSTCGKGFANATSLKSHITAIHLGVNRFQCRYCDEYFRTRTKRAKHEKKKHNAPEEVIKEEEVEDDKDKIQANIKKAEKRVKVTQQTHFQCSICNQVVSTYAGLKYHEARHKDEVFPCQDCPKVYNSRTSLNGHIRAVHRKVVFCCPCCTDTFTRRASVKRHLETQHKYTPEEINALVM